MSPSEVVSSLSSVSFESFPFPFISEKTGQFLMELESNGGTFVITLGQMIIISKKSNIPLEIY
jgi:hypothetical protein